jgi:hypothetical protein
MGQVVVGLVAWCLLAPPAVVTEYSPLGSLCDVLKKVRAGHLVVLCVAEVMRCVAGAWWSWVTMLAECCSCSVRSIESTR